MQLGGFPHWLSWYAFVLEGIIVWYVLHFLRVLAFFDDCQAFCWHLMTQ